MKNILAFCFVLFGFTNLFCQNSKVDTVNKSGTRYPEGDIRYAKFQGGDINKYIAEHLVYPKSKHNQGIVYISFTIEENGTVDSVRIRRGVDSSLNAEALRVITSMPKWTPATQNGKPVSQKLTIPIHFIFKDDSDSQEKKPEQK